MTTIKESADVYADDLWQSRGEEKSANRRAYLAGARAAIGQVEETIDASIRVMAGQVALADGATPEQLKCVDALAACLNELSTSIRNLIPKE